MRNPASDKQPEEQLQSTLSIMEIGLPTRARNALLGAGIRTVVDALEALGKGDETLTKVKGFGPKSLADLKKRLQEQGFALPHEAASPPVTMAEEEIPKGRSSGEVSAPGEATPEAKALSGSLGQRLVTTIVCAWDQFGFKVWLYSVVVGAVFLLLLSALLMGRLSAFAYMTLDARERSLASGCGCGSGRCRVWSFWRARQVVRCGRRWRDCRHIW